MIYHRTLEKAIKDSLFQGKVLCIFGPRRSGKTTLAKELLSTYGTDGYYLNCENLQERQYLLPNDPERLKNHLENKKIVVFDEAQTVEGIGTILKVFSDTYPDIQLIATGSSSFELANRTGEPLVGRSKTFFLYPLSYEEIIATLNTPSHAILEQSLLFGSYPAVAKAKTQAEKITQLSSIATGYLYKDIFTFERIRKPRLIEDLLKLIALQLGSEVSMNELAQTLGVGRPTVERYLELLEKAFVIRRLHALKRNLRNEIKGNFKVYFFDLGIRNYIINAFGPLDTRMDVGPLFENYFIMERMKKMENQQGYLPPVYFWRTHAGQEIDYIEEKDGNLASFECKWNPRAAKQTPPTAFITAYPNSTFSCVTSENFNKFL